jgi:sialate O-acetylesterase
MNHQRSQPLTSHRVGRCALLVVALLLATALVGFAGLSAEQSAGPDALRLAGIFGNNMVLQQGALTPVWGWAAPGQEVEVVVAGQTVRATAGSDGKWMVKFANLQRSDGPVTLSAKGPGSLLCTNVLIGDVWLGSGQSNMEWPTREITDASAVISAAKHPSIRLFTVPRVMKAQRAYDVQGRWVVCQPETVREFSAVLYLFGREIHTQTGMPLGLVHSSVGGTRIELWTAPEGFELVPQFAELPRSIRAVDERYRSELPPKLAELEAWLKETRAALAAGKPVPLTPDWPDHPHPRDGAAVLYDGMIYPLVPFALRGVIWYQGEWNGGENDIYVQRMKALIGGWRAVWGNPDLPFYYVQLARMPQKECLPWQGDGLAPTREAQRRSLAIPHTGMATIIDLEGNSDWHPRNKQDVARRLSLWALRNEYSRSNLVVSGPLFNRMTVEGDRVRIRFDSVGSGLMVATKDGLEPVKPRPDEPLRNFAIAGADRKWVHAKAVIEGKEVLVYSTEVPSPVAVRYAYCQDPTGCNFYNQEGLPASPFRTDNW